MGLCLVFNFFLTNQLINTSVKHNLTMDKAMGLMFLLFDIASYQVVPFHWPQISIMELAFCPPLCSSSSFLLAIKGYCTSKQTS